MGWFLFLFLNALDIFDWHHIWPLMVVEVERELKENNFLCCQLQEDIGSHREGKSDANNSKFCTNFRVSYHIYSWSPDRYPPQIIEFCFFFPFWICQSGIDEEPIGVVPDIGNVDLTDKKKQQRKRQKGGQGGDKRRNKPRFKLIRLKTWVRFDIWQKDKQVWHDLIPRGTPRKGS